MSMAYFSDKTQKRFPFIIFGLCVALAGNIVLITVHNNRQVEYAGVFLYLIGVIGILPVVVCWFAMNLRGHSKKAIGIPWQVGFGNSAGIIATFAFPSTDAPHYHLGYSLGLAFLCVGFAASLAYFVGCMVANRGRAKENRLIL